MVKLSIIIGTRPEIIKLSPIIRLTKKSSTDVIFTGQHYDYEMGLQFIEELNLRTPDYKLKLSKRDPANQTAEIIQKLGKIFSSTKPDAVIVEGDTNTVLAGAIAGLKSNIPVSHVEAGLRSFDWRMPEEHNRIVTVHLSELLFAPTTQSKQNLLQERVHGKIFVTGNTVIDALEYNLKLAERKRINFFDTEDFALLTLHRAENVDDKNAFRNILHALIEYGEKIVFPIHPRTKKRLLEFGFYNKIKNATNITLIDPVGYFEMLMMMKKCRFILTDSGGIQEEATSPKIRKKVLVLRKTTDRPEAVDVGLSEIVGTSKNRILKSIKQISENPKIPITSCPYGNGNASKKILNVLNKFYKI